MQPVGEDAAKFVLSVAAKIELSISAIAEVVLVTDVVRVVFSRYAKTCSQAVHYQ